MLVAPENFAHFVAVDFNHIDELAAAIIGVIGRVNDALRVQDVNDLDRDINLRHHVLISGIVNALLLLRLNSNTLATIGPERHRGGVASRTSSTNLEAAACGKLTCISLQAVIGAGSTAASASAEHLAHQ